MIGTCFSALLNQGLLYLSSTVVTLQSILRESISVVSTHTESAVIKQENKCLISFNLCYSGEAILTVTP